MSEQRLGGLTLPPQARQEDVDGSPVRPFDTQSTIAALVSHSLTIAVALNDRNGGWGALARAKPFC